MVEKCSLKSLNSWKINMIRHSQGAVWGAVLGYHFDQFFDLASHFFGVSESPEVSTHYQDGKNIAHELVNKISHFE